MNEIPHLAMKELAESGSLCETCGGLHVTNMDTALLSLSIGERNGAKLPWCSCEECPSCSRFRHAVEDVLASRGLLDTRQYPEDAL